MAWISSPVVGRSNEPEIRDTWLLSHTATKKPYVTLHSFLNYWIRVWKFLSKSRSFSLLFSLKMTFLFIHEHLQAFSYLFISLPFEQSECCNESSSNSTVLLYGDFILQLGYTIYRKLRNLWEQRLGGINNLQFLLEDRGLIAGLFLPYTIWGGLSLGKQKGNQFPSASWWCVRMKFWDPKWKAARPEYDSVSTSFLTLKFDIIVISHNYCFIGSTVVLLFLNRNKAYMIQVDC